MKCREMGKNKLRAVIWQVLRLWFGPIERGKYRNP